MILLLENRLFSKLALFIIGKGKLFQLIKITFQIIGGWIKGMMRIKTIQGKHPILSVCPGRFHKCNGFIRTPGSLMPFFLHPCLYVGTILPVGSDIIPTVLQKELIIGIGGPVCAMMGLRMVRGVDEARFLRDFGRAPEAVWTKSLPRLMREGMLAREDGRLYLTARGMQVMNAVLVEMMEETEG